MLNKLLFTTAGLLIAISAQAKLSPVYTNIRIIDEAVEAMTEIKDVDADELLVSKIDIINSNLVTVSTGDIACDVKIKHIQPPAGISGAATVSGSVIDGSCSDVSKETPSMAYEKISAKLMKAASLGKMIDSVEVKKSKTTGKLLVKIGYSK